MLALSAPWVQLLMLLHISLMGLRQSQEGMCGVQEAKG